MVNDICILYSQHFLYFQYLAIPVEKEVKVYNSETWDVAFTLTDDSIKQVAIIFKWVYVNYGGYGGNGGRKSVNYGGKPKICKLRR